MQNQRNLILAILLTILLIFGWDSAMRLQRMSRSGRAPCVAAQSDIVTAWAWWKIIP